MAPRKGTKFTRLTQDEIDQVVSLYLSGLPSEEVASIVGRSSGIVRRILLRLGISRPVGHHLRKYHPREDAFDNAESNEEAAYWIGFLMADGGIIPDRGKQPSIALELKIADRPHVEAFATFLGLPLELVRDGYNGRQSVFLKFRSAALAESLARFGIVPRKSLTAEPKLLTENRHFMRGLIDGDGCLHIQSVRKKHEECRRVGLHFIGSEAVVNVLVAFAARLCPDCHVHPKKVLNSWTWATVGRHAATLIRYLYDNCTIALPRKLAIAQEAMSFGPTGYLTTSQEDSPHGREPLGKRFLTRNGETKSLAEWARIAGIDPVTLAARLRYGWSVERALTTPVAAGRRKTLTCTRPGCDRPYSASGLCTMHYKRVRRGRAD